MNTREILKEFTKGCSNGHDCEECLEAAVMAIRADLVPQWHPVETCPQEELVYVSGRHKDGTAWFNIGTLWGDEWDGS